MMQKKEYTDMDILIYDYLNGNLNQTEKKELEAWVSSSSNHKQYYYEQTEIWIATQATLCQGGNKDAAYQRFMQRIEKRTFQRLRTFKIMRYAASIFLGISLIGGSFYLGTEYDEVQIAESIQSVEVPLGSRSRVVLQDGTTVWLNAGSKLTYSSQFQRSNRSVTLDGEGYFDVTPNADLPFTVNTKEINIEVLGTEFNVKSYHDESEVSVALAEGVVNFINKIDTASSFIMRPEQLTVYNKESKQTKVTTVPISEMGQWINGSHFFNEQSLVDILNTLEKSFDIRFVFLDESKKECSFYASFRKHETLDDILQILSSSGKFKYKKRNKRIDIY